MSENVDDLFSEEVNECIAPIIASDVEKSEFQKKRGLEGEKACSTPPEIFGDFSEDDLFETPINIEENKDSEKFLVEKNEEKDKKKEKGKKKRGRPKGVKNRDKKNDNIKIYEPQPGPQTQFLESKADIVFYGGSRGGGKSYSLFLESLRNVGNSGFNAIFLRQTNREIMDAGQLWDTSFELYGSINGAEPVKSDKRWDFPSGAKIQFAGLEKEQDKFKFQGASIALIMFDEVCGFDEGSFWFLLTSNRSTCGVRPYVRCTCNPDPDSFVCKLISWWIGPEGYAIPERSGVIRYFMRSDDIIVWGDSKKELLEIDDNYLKEKEKIEAETGAEYVKVDKLRLLKKSYLNGYKSFTFIASSVTDNKILMEADPTYIANLRALPKVEKEQFLYGNWKIRASKGDIFNRKDFKNIQNVLPDLSECKSGVKECRFWDFSYVTDYTASVKMRKYPNDDKFYVVDVTQFRLSPSETEDIFLGVSLKDKRLAEEFNINYMVRWEEEPGSAAKKESVRLTSLLAGYNCKGIRSTKSKLTRATPFAIQVGIGNVVLQKAEWNEKYILQHHGFTGERSTSKRKDDMVDGSSGAFSELTSNFIQPCFDEEEVNVKKKERDIMEDMLKAQEELEEDFLNGGDDFGF